MRVLIISDFREWAFGHISKNVKKFARNDVDIIIIYLNEHAIEIAQDIWKEFDIIFVMGWYLYQHFQFIPKEKVITSISSFCQWDMQGFVIDMSDKIDLLKNDIEKCKCMGNNMR